MSDAATGTVTFLLHVLILFSTLGGILAFGPLGFIIGPILAGLFVTSWDIFAVAYRDVLEDGTASVEVSEVTAGHEDPPSVRGSSFRTRL